MGTARAILRTLEKPLSAETIQTLIARTEAMMRTVIDEIEAESRESFLPGDLPLYDVIRYHLGWVDQTFEPDDADPGKRIRPAICLLACGAAGGAPERAVPVAAAIELLHNFTLMHDDIQDRSELRRGRQTVWKNWGDAQAINAGDATFAVSQLALLRLAIEGVDAATVHDLVDRFNRMTLRIVEGQVLDLGFEQRWDIVPDDYLRMISGKTAAIVAFAAWAGARVAGTAESVGRYGEFGHLLGLGFQVRDDYLGIWGDDAATGKSQGDDIRGRKKSIPIVMLLERLSPQDLAELQAIYASETIEPDQVEQVMALLARHEVAPEVQRVSMQFHDRALELLNDIAQPSPYRDALRDLTEQLVDRVR
jgi:geranylgeranyl diphosphate synthase, type I